MICQYIQIFSNYYINKFNLLHKGVYPHEHVDDWKKFRGKSVPVKEDFYSYLNLEDITDIKDFKK